MTGARILHSHFQHNLSSQSLNIFIINEFFTRLHYS
jgi:hypothetical protein